MMQSSGPETCRGKSSLPGQIGRHFQKLHPRSERHKEQEFASHLEASHPAPPQDPCLISIVTVRRDGVEILKAAETYRKGKVETGDFISQSAE